MKLFVKTANLNSDEDKLKVSALFEDWQPGNYKKKDIRNVGVNTWECFQDHDNSIYPDINPDNESWFTFWRILHGKSVETARPFYRSQYSGAHDTYKVGEFVIFNEKIYECVFETIYNPEEYSQAWRYVCDVQI